MAIQNGGGPLRIDSDDLQLTHRGKTIAVKIRNIAWPQVLGCSKQADGSWKADIDLTGDLFSSDVPGGGDPVAYHMAGEPDAFVRTVVLPNLNAWLATLWAPTSEGSANVTPLEQLQASILRLRLVVRADGTVVSE